HHPQWFFDEVILRNVTELSLNSFGDVAISELYIEHAPRLRYISRHAFPIVLYGNNIKAIGSYAFNNLPNLEDLRIDGNNIILVDKYAFATNYTSFHPLRLTMVANNLNENSFAFMAMNGAQRPVHLSFAEIGGCYWNMKYLDEQIFAPFLDKSTNRVYIEPECEFRCNDCRMKWLIEIPKHAQKRITLLAESNYRSIYNVTNNEGYVPCENGANLYDNINQWINEWNNCP
ncbi:Leucine rich repeat containing protein, partial [Euroglyphus maynei]